MHKNKTCRDAELRITREAESRNNEMLLQYNMEYVSPLDIPIHVKREGFSYQWVTREVKGEATYDVERAASQGWTLVPADRAPEFCFDPLKRNPLTSQYVCYKDLILMERPSLFSQKELNMFNNNNDTIMKSLRGVESDYTIFSNTTRSISSF